MQFQPDIKREYLTPGVTGYFDATQSLRSPETVALDKIREIAGGEWVVEYSYPTRHNKLTHVYLRQMANGLEIANCEVNVNVAPTGEIISMGVSAFKGEMPVETTNVVSAEEAIFRLAVFADVKVPQQFVPYVTKFEDNVFYFEVPSVSSEEITAKLVYAKVSEEKLALVWQIRMVADMPNQPYGAYVGLVDASDVDADIIGVYDQVKWYMPQEQAEELARLHKAELQSVLVNDTDFADRALYLVYGIPNMDPNWGERVTERGDTIDRNASPRGWFDQGNNRVFTDTRGNNVFAQDNPSGGAGWINNYRPSCGASLDCRFPIDLRQQPVTYKDGSILNLFWWNNIIHDMFWLHGFDEVSGNAQENNLGRGGRENDAVQANAQDGAGFNNANMMTPPDGQRGRMRMYLWNGITPMRDGDLDSGIIVHEYAHHISQRLTGGPLNVGCLNGGQAGGMGEGWGDFFATLFLQRQSTTRSEQFPMGLYAARRGIRPFPYTASRATNPQTFGILNQGPPYNAVHAIGSVWCQILFQVYWEMRDEFGWSPDWFYGERGNNALLQDVTDGLKLQPCTPNFVQARDAILTADRQNYQGRHLCALWRGFAFRGLGTGAVVRSTNSVTESFAVPPECQQ